MGQCPDTDGPGWCMPFSQKGLFGILFSVLLLPGSPCPSCGGGGEAAFAFSGHEGCVEASLSSGREGVISHLLRFWP